MAGHLILAGAGHAHMVTIDRLDTFVSRGHKVTVIGPSPVHYYSGMGPGMLGGSYTPEEISFNSRSDVERNGAEFVQDSVVQIEPENRRVILRSGRNLEYDVLSCNLGSSIQKNITLENTIPVYSVKPISNLLEARKLIIEEAKKRTIRIGVVGGGPSACELAGNIIQLSERERLNRVQVMVFARSELMSGFSERVRRSCRRYLVSQGVEILEHQPVKGLKGNSLVVERKETVQLDLVLLAAGVVPSDVFTHSGMKCGADGGLLVNEYLQSVEYSEVFGGGDCISFAVQPLDKVGVYAVRQNSVLYENMMNSLEGMPLKRFDPGGRYLLIFNLGGGYGVLEKGPLFWRGKLAFLLKDYIDRKFMRAFKQGAG